MFKSKNNVVIRILDFNFIEKSPNKNEIKEEEEPKSKEKKKKEIKFIKFKRVRETKLEKKINEILYRSKSGNNFDKVELAYKELKPPLDELLSKPKTTEETEIIRENSKILIFLDLLNKILSLVSDGAIPMFKKRKQIVVQKNKNKNKDINSKRRKK